VLPGLPDTAFTLFSPCVSVNSWMMGPVGILYEHPEWFTPLFAELDRRGVDYDKLHAPTHTFDPSEREIRHGVVVNRMSPSAWLRGAESALFFTLDQLAYLDAARTHS